jgi:hypothetical protein
MKNLALIILLLFSVVDFQAQTPSDCTVPYELIENYERDIKNLSMRRMMELNSPDFALISIPQAWQDTIAGGMAAIMNALSLPESDSVFNLYCVHDLTSPMQIYNEMLIQIDVSYPWTLAWQNLNALTGNSAIDAFVTRYGLTVTAFHDWSFGDYAVLHTDSLLNIYALIDSLVAVEGVISGEPNAFLALPEKLNTKNLEISGIMTFIFSLTTVLMVAIITGNGCLKSMQIARLSISVLKTGVFLELNHCLHLSTVISLLRSKKDICIRKPSFFQILLMAFSVSKGLKQETFWLFMMLQEKSCT